MRFADHLTSVADIMLVTVQEGEIRVNLGDALEGSGFGAAQPMFCGDGFVSVPNEPTETGACQALYVQDGDEKIVVGARDHRWHERLGNPVPGDKFVVSDTSARFVLKKSEHTVTMYSTVDGTDDTRSIYQMIGPNGWELVTPWGQASLGPLGFHVSLTSGPRFDLGAMGGIPPPLNAFTSYAGMSAGIVNISAGMMNLGSDGGLANGLGVAALKACLVASNAAFVAVNATLSTALPISGITDANKTALATATAALTAATTALNLLINGIGKVV